MTRTYWRRLHDAARVLASLRGGAERRLFVAVLLLAPSVRLLARLPLPWLSRTVTALARASRTPSRIPPERVAHIVGLTQAFGHPLVRRGCLTRGVLLLWILRRHAIDVELAFGIGGPGDGYAGHCWLVRDGEPYLEDHGFGDRFVETFRIPGMAGT